MKIVYIFVEGNTDRALIDTLLQKKFGYGSVNKLSDMPELLQRQVSKYPGDNGSLENKSKPIFLCKGESFIMIAISGGKEKMAAEIRARLLSVMLANRALRDSLFVVAIFDRDLEMDNASILRKFERQLEDKSIKIHEGKISFSDISIDFDYHVIPQKCAGAVESIIIELAGMEYPVLVDEARAYRNAIESKAEFESIRRNWSNTTGIQRLYCDKVQVGAITTVLKPDSSPAFMVQDVLLKRENLESACEISEISNLIEYLSQIVE